ncbi:MAG: hypothetical protein AB7I42_22920 [Bradyrhizobium sp.]|uniref:hypothetical protein n=1 Tax=Bradyrhizobium sp. TaxID=376 RepID=UPI003D0CDFAF
MRFWPWVFLDDIGAAAQAPAPGYGYPGPRFTVPEKPAQAAADEEPQTRYAILSEHDAIVLLVQLRNRCGSASAMYDAMQKAGVVLARERVE